MSGFKETEGWQIFDMGPYPYLRFKISNNKIIEPQLSIDGKTWCEAARGMSWREVDLKELKKDCDHVWSSDGKTCLRCLKRN